MSPTVCCSIFSALSDTGLSSASDAVKVTARQSCFRHEGRSTSGLQRLREFHMRELVVLGNAGTVRNYSRWMQQEMCSLLENLQLDGRIESATDPFFFNNSVEKRLFQTSFDLKKEMRLHADAPDGTIAAASVNIHQDHFGRSMNIRCESEPAVSCCAGFGIDRLCYALYSQHGTDMQHWDSSLTAFIKSGGVQS
jgi:seryl-tRNA synthetase